MRQQARTIDGFPTGVYWWDSMAEFVETFEPAMKKRNRLPEHCVSRSWTGETWADVRRKCLQGDATRVHEAENLLEDIVLQVETTMSEWQNSIAGPVPDCAAAVAGMPESMFMQVEVESDRAPVRIVVDITSSGGIDHEHLTTRGIACLALAMVVSRQRPVELYVVSALGSQGRAGANVIRVGTTPLDMSLACYALTSQGMCRGVGYSWLQQILGTDGGWAWGLAPFSHDGRQKYISNMVEVVSDGETIIQLIPPTHLHDPLVDDPLGFIRRSVDDLNRVGDHSHDSVGD